MTHENESFKDVAKASQGVTSRLSVWTFTVMVVHFALTGAGVFVTAVGLLWLRYQDLTRIDLGLDLRITNPGTIYERSTQLILAEALILGVVSLLPLRAVSGLNRRQRSAIPLARIAALLLLGGVLAAGGLWMYMDRLPADRAEMSTIQQVVDDVSLAIYIIIILLIAQSVLAMWYQIWLSLADSHLILYVQPSSRQVLLQRIRTVGWVVGLLLLGGLGITLGVVTDWLYELPVERPNPSEFLYATTFDAFNEEWDVYWGRDNALITDSDSIGQVTGEVLSVEYGTGASEGLVWSSLDRKFNDFDLRVTTQVINGPDDESMYGVMFRYKDKNNFYLFRISGDGYYSLRKVTNGVIEEVSEWNFSDVIRQGPQANEIRIIADHDSFQIFINGQNMPLCLKGENLHSMWAGPEACVEGGELTFVYRDSSFDQGKIALFAGSIYGSEVSVSFDDVLIIGPSTSVEIVE